MIPCNCHYFDCKISINFLNYKIMPKKLSRKQEWRALQEPGSLFDSYFGDEPCSIIIGGIRYTVRPETSFVEIGNEIYPV